MKFIKDLTKEIFYTIICCIKKEGRKQIKEQLTYFKDNFLELSKEVARKQSSIHIKRAKVGPLFWTIFGIVVAVAALAVSVASLVVSIKTYNNRYDANAEAAGGLEFTFAANGNNTGCGSFTSSAGTITYGYFQRSGSTPTQYTLYYKNSNRAKYLRLKNFTVYRNNDYTGDFQLAEVRSSTRFDIKCVKNDNRKNKTVFEFDWAII